MKVYQAYCDDGSCCFANIDDAIEFINEEIKGDIDFNGDETRKYWIKVEEMTEEEFKNLPEFDGF